MDHRFLSGNDNNGSSGGSTLHDFGAFRMSGGSFNDRTGGRRRGQQQHVSALGMAIGWIGFVAQPLVRLEQGLPILAADVHVAALLGIPASPLLMQSADVRHLEKGLWGVVGKRLGQQSVEICGGFRAFHGDGHICSPEGHHHNLCASTMIDGYVFDGASEWEKIIQIGSTNWCARHHCIDWWFSIFMYVISD